MSHVQAPCRTCFFCFVLFLFISYPNAPSRSLSLSLSPTLHRAHALHEIPVNTSRRQGTLTEHRTHYIEHTFYRERILSVSCSAQDSSRRQAALEAAYHRQHPTLSNSLDMPHRHEVYQPLNNKTNPVVKRLNTSQTFVGSSNCWRATALGRAPPYA